MSKAPNLSFSQINTVVKKLPTGNEVETTYGLCVENQQIYKWDWKTGSWIQNWKETNEVKE